MTRVLRRLLRLALALAVVEVGMLASSKPYHAPTAAAVSQARVSSSAAAIRAHGCRVVLSHGAAVVSSCPSGHAAVFVWSGRWPRRAGVVAASGLRASVVEVEQGGRIRQIRARVRQGTVLGVDW